MSWGLVPPLQEANPVRWAPTSGPTKWLWIPMHSDEPASQITPGDRRSLVLRALVIAAAAVAAAVAFVAFERAGDRTASAAGEVIAFGPDAYDSVVSASPDVAAFLESTVWTLPSSQAQLVDDGQGVPVARLADSSTGHLVGLENGGEIIGLALVPPRLDAEPATLLVSRESTVLALVALHPDVTAADPDTVISRIEAVSNEPGFAELAASIDGTPLAQWGQQNRAALEGLVSAARQGVPIPAPSCADAAAVAPDVFRCPSDGSIENYSGQSIVLVDGGRPCGVAVSVSQPVSAAARASIAALIETGAMPAPSSIGTLVAASSPTACGATSGVSPDADARRFSLWLDDAVPYARLVGFDVPVGPEVPSIATLEALAALGDQADNPTVLERIELAAELLRDRRSFARSGGLPISGASSQGLATLVELLSAVYDQ